ncbi:signal peptide peptidase SppA [Candidatus Woesearchaeota archaeon]|nr:signal peptide peptidase SppA [Candidatus Woesearchaeota archaeon]
MALQTKKDQEKGTQKKSWLRWLFVLLIIGAVLIVSMLIAGVIAFLFAGDSSSYGGSGNVAVIPITGIILTERSSGFFSDDVTSSTDIVAFIEQAENDPTIKAILFEINSPGGSAVASDEIGTAIKKTTKPTVAWIREVGASGGYWVASTTDVIVANRMSITGSIGVVASYLEFSGFLRRYNITYQEMTGGTYKELGSPMKSLSDSERALLQQKIDRIHAYFIQEVADNRNLDKATVKEIATGEFFLGVEAKDLGLVDVLGGQDEVFAILEESIEETPQLVRYEKKRTLFDVLGEVFSQQSFYIGQGIGTTLVNQATRSPQVQITT